MNSRVCLAYFTRESTGGEIHGSHDGGETSRGGPLLRKRKLNDLLTPMDMTVSESATCKLNC